MVMVYLSIYIWSLLCGGFLFCSTAVRGQVTPDQQLYNAVTVGDVTKARAALEAGANVNAKYYASQQTPLMLAASCNRTPDLFALLVKQHPDVNLLDHDGNTALHYLVENRSSNVALMEKMGTEAYMRKKDEDQLRMAQMLIEHGANVNRVDDFGYTPLQVLIANANHSLGVINLLVRHGANLNYTGKRGKAALCLAIEQYRWWQAEALLRAHANPNVRDSEGRTPLMIEYPQNISEYRLLIDYGADIDARDNEGRTPLITLFENACTSRTDPRTDNEGEFKPEGISMPDEHCLAFLLRRHPNMNARTKSGMTALKWAERLATECTDPANYKIVAHYIETLKKAGARK